MGSNIRPYWSSPDCSVWTPLWCEMQLSYQHDTQTSKVVLQFHFYTLIVLRLVGSKIEPIRVAQLSNLAMTYNISCSSMKKKCLKFLDVLTEFDLFAPNITVRYQSDNDFKTLTGAILSFALIVFFGVIFVNRFTVMLNRTEITASVLKQEELDPRYYNTSTPNFLFAIGVIFMPLSSPTLIWTLETDTLALV